MRSVPSISVPQESVVQAFFEQSTIGRSFRRVRRRWEWGIVVTSALLFLLGLWIIGSQFWFGLQTGVWSDYLLRTATSLQLLTGGIAIARYRRSWRHEDELTRGVTELRETLVFDKGGESTDSSALASRERDTLAGDSARVLHLRTPAGGEQTFFFAYVLIALIIGLFALGLAVGFAVWALANHIAYSTGQVVLAAICGVIGLALLVLIVPASQWMRRLARAAWFEADEMGVRPVGAVPGGERVLAWPEVRAYFQLSGGLFGLDTGMRLLVWKAPLLGKGDDHQWLLRQITTRTGLTPIVLDTQVREITRRSSHQVGKLGALVTVGVVVALLLVLLPGAWVTQRIQAWQYGQLITRIHAERPLYHSALASDDGQWQLDGGGSPSADFSPAGFTVLGTDTNPIAIAESRQQYAEAAVEVTMRQIRATDPRAAIGLILRGAFGDKDAVSVTVDQTGEWDARDFDFSSADPNAAFGQSAAIHTQTDATNTLLVLMRGPQYLIYMNGQFVGTYYHAPAHPAAISLWGDTIVAQGGQFSDLTIYPAIYD